MFFIGIMGVDQKQKQVGSTYSAGLSCSGCGAMTRLNIHKAYTYFHFFFIPLFRWNVHYLAESTCCRHVYELAPELGRAFEAGQEPEIRAEHLRNLDGDEEQAVPRACWNCHRPLAADHGYCPYCGQKQ